ncbi:MAG: hypothetical protein B7733_08035 [Myxococcales bacterium FL481]|nr:MAG: hypothetical protein B7733_08035 [Myxococcales bacterium FL481]
MISRRDLSSGLAAALSTLWLPGPARAEASSRLERRLELWRTFARRSDRLLARYTARRQSSMLLQPVQVSGTLGFLAPHQLTLRDDGQTGSTTVIDGEAVRIAPNDGALPTPAVDDPVASPALAWLRDRLLTLFAPGSLEGFGRGCTMRAPRGSTPRIELLPQSGSTVRKRIRRVDVTLDPVGGAIVRIQIDEAQGDTLALALSDHRQTVDLEQLRELGLELSEPGGERRPSQATTRRPD